MTQRSMMGLVRKGKLKIRGSCFLVTWDIDSEDSKAVDRVQYFLFGRRYVRNGKQYEYPGFVWEDGVRYVAQSAILVIPELLDKIIGLLASNGIDHEIEPFVRP